MYEQGYRTPSIEILLSLSKLFNVSVDYIICNEFNTDNKNDNLSKKELQILNIIKKVKGDLSTIDLKKFETVLTYSMIEYD